MPLLSFSNPRNKATLIAALLLLEFIAILWFRDSRPRSENISRTSILNRSSSHDQYHVQDDLQYRQQQQHNGEHHQRHEDGHGDRVGANTREPKADLRARGWSIEDGEEQKDRRYHHHHHHHHQHQESKHPAATVAGSIDTKDGSNIPATKKSALSSFKEHIIKSSSALGPSIKDEKNTISSKFITSTGNSRSSIRGMVRKSSRKSANKQKGYPAKSHKHRVQAKNQRAGFKSTEERKLAQLIPALDENGMIIENHFISPRDTDGDGTPDSYVLLRPAADSEYMMDIGLFDDEIVAPVPAALSSEFTARDPAATIITTAASAMEVPVETAICEDAGAGPNTSSPLLSAAPSMLAA